VRGRWGSKEQWTVHGTAKGSALDRLVLAHPFIERDSLLINGDHVTLDAGTGCVHTAPAHGDLLLSVRSPDVAEWAHCREMLARRGKGKINLAVSGFSDGVLAAEWAGRYVVLAA